MRPAIFLISLMFPVCGFCLNAADYDTDTNGLISKSEFEIFIRDYVSKPLAHFDRDANSTLDPQELRLVAQEFSRIESEIEDYIVEFEENVGGEPIGEFANEFKLDDAKKYKKPNFFAKSKILIRENHESLDHVTKPKQSPKAATISLSRDIAAGNEVFTVKGAVLRPIRFANRPSYQLVPSAEVNRVTNDKNPDKDVNSLVFRLSSSFERDTPWKSIQTLYTRASPVLATSVDFDVDVRGLELQFEPIANQWGFGNFKPVGEGKSWQYLATGIWHMEWGRVYESGDNAKLVENENYLRAGPKASIKLLPPGLERLVFGLSYEYLHDLGGDLRARKQFEASLSFDLDEDGHFKLVSKYTDGDSSVALEDQQIWTGGLGIKF